jgi:hypothetical protein
VINNFGGWDYDINNDSFYQIITLPTGINSILNNSPKIHLKTGDGCFQTNIYFKENVFIESNIYNNVIIASTINDLEQIQNDFFNLLLLDTFTEEYFESYYLCFVLAWYTGFRYPKDERIIINNGKYYFEIEYWRRSLNDPRVYIGRAFNVLYIFEIPKY